jgi:MFS family permease
VKLAPGVGLAAVTTAVYIGFLSGPPLIGGLAEVLGLRLALLLLVISTGIGAALAGSVEK